MVSAGDSRKIATVRHILVPTKPQAKEILDAIRSAKKPLKVFKKLAKDYSKCPSSKKGGLLDEFTEGQMVKEFEQAVWSSEIETVPSEFVRTKFGYHIIWVHDLKH
jgi:peptidyl-prolyl cis-trans isomerase C